MKTVLVVDDLESVRFYHQLLLQQCGYQTLTAADGAQALAMVAEREVDLVMLDLLMPKLDGVEFMRRVRQLPQRAALPVLVISSEAQQQLATDARALGHCELLQKPILPDTLRAAVQRLIR